ncbi:MAG: hypothetical protein JXA20_03575 [Spirochaetes bacterium]|nr:hypothetical protein [Spirochaetota bacterium]
MKRIALIVCTALAATALFHGSAGAFSVSVGANLWYNWWSPAWGSSSYHNMWTTGMNMGYNITDLPDYEMDSGLLYGPALSVRFLDRFSLGSIFMYGKFRYSTEGIARALIRSIWPAYNLVADFPAMRATREVTRWDSDTTLSYSVTDIVALFVGFKAQGYRYSEEYIVDDGTYMESSTTVSNYGIGVGTGFTVPLFQNVFVLVNISGIVLWGSEASSLDRITKIPIMFFEDGTFISYGGTASLTFAYVFQPLNTTLAVGGRYQLLTYHQKAGDRGFDDFDGRMDHYFGITVSAVYTFSFD